jgi:hypothetical protein
MLALGGFGWASFICILAHGLGLLLLFYGVVKLLGLGVQNGGLLAVGACFL